MNDSKNLMKEGAANYNYAFSATYLPNEKFIISMNTYKEEVIHYPTLRTVLMVERVLRNAETAIDREELKRRLPAKIMHQTLNIVLAYLEDRGLIIDGHKGILWIHNPSPKLRRAIERGKEM